MGKRILIGIVVIGAVVALRFMRRSNAEDSLLAEMKGLIQNLPDYPANAAYLDSLLERKHSAAFALAYTTGGRRRADKFDDIKYFEEPFRSMILDCRDAKKDALVDQLQQARDALLAIVKEDNGKGDS